MSRVLRLDLEYDGAEFSGWAAQPGLRTVEGELAAALGDPAARAGASWSWPAARTPASTPRARSPA